MLRDKDIRRIVKNGNVIEDFVKKNDTEHITSGDDTPQGLEPKSRPDTHDTNIPPKDLKEKIKSNKLKKIVCKKTNQNKFQ